MLSICSHAYFPSVYLLVKCMFVSFAYLKIDLLFVLGVLYILQIQVVFQIYDLQIFSPTL